MSDKKISQLDAVTTVEDTDEYVVARAGASNKITGASLKAAVGSSNQIVTASVTTDPITFQGSHVFDLGWPTVLTFKATATAADADGETWGAGPSDIACEVRAFEMSYDNVTWQSFTFLGNGFYDDPYEGGTLPQLTRRYMTFAPRYVRVTCAIFDVGSDFSDLYSGPNHPVCSHDIVIEYRS